MSTPSPEPEPLSPEDLAELHREMHAPLDEMSEWRLAARARLRQRSVDQSLQILIDDGQDASAYALDEAVRGILMTEWLGPESPWDAIYQLLPSWQSPPLRASSILHLVCGVERRRQADADARHAEIMADMDALDALDVQEPRNDLH